MDTLGLLSGHTRALRGRGQACGRVDGASAPFIADQKAYGLAACRITAVSVRMRTNLSHDNEPLGRRRSSRLSVADRLESSARRDQAARLS